jgi:integrase
MPLLQRGYWMGAYPLRIPAYLQRNRFGIYQFRRAVPPRLRSAIRKTEIIRSLGTREPREALRLARILANHIDNVFTDLESIMAGKPPKKLRQDYVVEIPLGDGTIARTTTTPEDVAAWTDAGLSPEQITSLLKAPLEGLSTRALPSSSPAPTPTPSAKQGPNLSKLIADFDADRIAARGGKWEAPKGDATKFRRLVELLNDCPCSEVTRTTARNVRDQLLLLPSNTARFRGQHISELLKMSHADTLSPKSVGDHIELYSRLFKWAQHEGFYDAPDPFQGLSPTDPVPKNKKREPFTSEELESIFSGPMFIAFDPERHRIHHYWAPLIMLHSGIRNAEIAALQVDDLKELKGGDRSVWVFDINTKADKKRVKSPNAVRQVPVHQKLIDLGLLEFREQIQALGQLRLFPYLKWEKGNGYGRYLGENFSTYLKTLGIHSNRKKVLYSFRHTIATRLERAKETLNKYREADRPSVS